ncbi:MAG TPA: TlpA disulfide reductase family protein [Candidatus Limnocylindrales bacterium]|nr:TlpA disulfide reductase family protein [Candidatus Limnocylindrales bacterium]
MALALGSVVVAAVVIAVATRPLGTVGNAGPVNPQPTAFRIGDPVPGLEPGSLAPEFTVDLPDGSTFGLADPDGRPIRLADLRGKAVWVNFWASWCPPCQFETPFLREVDEAYRDRGLVIVGINVQETADVARDYAERYGLRYPIGADVSGHIFHAYRVFALPTQFFIDPDGIIRFVVQGPLSAEAAAARVEAILPEE